jgi:hypothetical protein
MRKDSESKHDEKNDLMLLVVIMKREGKIREA